MLKTRATCRCGGSPRHRDECVYWRRAGLVWGDSPLFQRRWQGPGGVSAAWRTREAGAAHTYPQESRCGTSCRWLSRYPSRFAKSRHRSTKDPHQLWVSDYLPLLHTRPPARTHARTHAHERTLARTHGHTHQLFWFFWLFDVFETILVILIIWCI